MTIHYVDEIKELAIRARITRGIKQADMAKALGVSDSLVSRFEAGIRDCHWMAMEYAAIICPDLVSRFIHDLAKEANANG